VLFVGRRRGEAVATAVQRKQAGDVVSEVGGVSRPMLAALYRRATALVHPSLHEGFGIPLVEAMCYGVPIVASSQPCIPEICDGAAALLSPTDPAPWAVEMHRLIADPARRAHLAELSRGRAGAFGWARTWRGVDDALDAALDEAPAGARAGEAIGALPASPAPSGAAMAGVPAF
jgi:glycosyltransferase involved in cell wall biosynthesis